MKTFSATIISRVVLSLLCVIAALPTPARGEDVLDMVDDVWRRITSPSARPKQARKASRPKDYEQEYRRNQEEIDHLKAEKRKHDEQRIREKEKEIRLKEEELARRERQLREAQERLRREDSPVASRALKGDQEESKPLPPTQAQPSTRSPGTLAFEKPTVVPFDVEDPTRVFNEWLRHADIQAALAGDKADLVFLIRKEHPHMAVGTSEKLDGCILAGDGASPDREFLASAKASAAKVLNREIAVAACTSQVGDFPLVVVSAATVKMENFDKLKPILSEVVSSKAAIIYVADYRKYLSDHEAQQKNDSLRCITMEVAGPYFTNACAWIVAREMGKSEDAANFEKRSHDERKKYSCAPSYLSAIETGAAQAARDITSNETFSKLAIFSSTVERYCRARLERYLQSDKK